MLTIEQRRAKHLLERQLAEIKKAERAPAKARHREAKRRQRDDLKDAAEGQRKPRRHDAGYLAHVRLQPCILSGIADDCQGRTDPAHLRFSDAKVGRLNPGTANKSDDKWVLPLCRHHHDAQHACGNERRWWSQWGIDPNAECETRYAAFRSTRPMPEVDLG